MSPRAKAGVRPIVAIYSTFLQRAYDQLFQEVALQNLPVAFNDVDLCLRIRELGYRIVWTPYAELYHHESASRGSDTRPDTIGRFNSEANYMRKRWGLVLDHDPYYNPNLGLDRSDFGLAFPPRVDRPWRRGDSG